MLFHKSRAKDLLSVCVFVLLMLGSNCYLVGPNIVLSGFSNQLTWKKQIARLASVSGVSYSSDELGAPSVRLFTKEGCTLCDKVKDVLLEIRGSHPHSLEQVDITDEENQLYFDRYKYDIPVLHINGLYWTKHRLSKEDAMKAIEASKDGSFVSCPGEPDASRSERKS